MLLTGKNNVADASSELLNISKAVFAITLGKEGTMLGIKLVTSIWPLKLLRLSNQSLFCLI
jgi:hypothetical protein